MGQEKVVPSAPRDVESHHAGWDDGVALVLVTRRSVVCASTLSEIP